jgi:hypothetical protein
MKIIKEEILFEEKDIFGKKIRVTKNYWEKVIIFKHKDIADKFLSVKKCIKNADFVEKSKTDPNVFLYYRREKRYLICVVVKHLNAHGFVVTSYRCKKPRRGEIVWQKNKKK